jgi:hypothetical protein
MFSETYRITLGPIQDNVASRHKHGGLPYGMNASDVPSLDSRHQPLHLLMEIDLADPIFNLPATSLRRLLVMNDANCYSFWEPLYYFVDEDRNRVELLGFQPSEENEWAPRILPQRAISISVADIPAHPTEYELREFEQSHFVGGKPRFIQGGSDIACIKCGKVMSYVAQFASLNDNDDDVAFGDLGTLYAFLCPTCHVVATIAECY